MLVWIGEEVVQEMMKKEKLTGKRVPFSILYCSAENITKWVFAHAGRHLLRPGHLCVT